MFLNALGKLSALPACQSVRCEKKTTLVQASVTESIMCHLLMYYRFNNHHSLVLVASIFQRTLFFSKNRDLWVNLTPRRGRGWGWGVRSGSALIALT